MFAPAGAKADVDLSGFRRLSLAGSYGGDAGFEASTAASSLLSNVLCVTTPRGDGDGDGDEDEDEAPFPRLTNSRLSA